MLPHPSRAAGCRLSIDYRSGAKAGNLLRIYQQSAAQPTATDPHMYHMIAPKHSAHLCRREHRGKRQIAPERPKLAASAFGPVEGGQQ